MVYVDCRGTESTLAECLYETQRSSCYNGIIGVHCSDQSSKHAWTRLRFHHCSSILLVTNGALRLTNGLTRYEGRVEVYWNNMGWKTMCNDGWDALDAIVACRQLNHLSTSIEVIGITAFLIYSPWTGFNKITTMYII